MSVSGAMAGELWLRHAAALRVLAAALTSDASEAEDLVQETWLRAARMGAAAETTRAWWSAVLRNLVRDRARERGRRAHTEREAARDERVPSEVEVLERLEIAQRVAAEVSRLDEPYRTAIHLRYFEGLSPAEIAQRLGAPLETVRTRLQRGLAQLRERMDRAFGGDRSAWSVSLAAIALHGEPATFATVGTSLVSLGALAMSLKTVLGIAALIALGLGAYLVRPKGDEANARAHEEIVEAPAPPSVTTPPEAQSAPLEPSLAAREPVAAPAASAPVPPPPGTIVVLDESGHEHATESGSLLLQVTEPRSEPVEVAVKDGAWDHALPEGATYYVSKIVLGERAAVAMPNSGPFVASAQAPRLRSQWTAVARLHVVDAASGAELDGIRLYTVDAFEAAGFETMVQRPKNGLVGEDLISPIEIRHSQDEHGFGPPTHFAGRSGYAWGRIQIDPTAGGDFVLKLSPGGDVHAAFERASRDPRLRLRLYSKTGSDLKWVFECGGEQLKRGTPPTLELEGLVPGSYAMRAEIGKQEQAQVLAEKEFEVVAGEKSNVALSVGELPKPEKVEVVITLRMDPSWSPEKCSLWLNPLNVDPRSPAARGVLVAGKKWTVVDAGTRTAESVLVDAGRYKCQIDELCFGTEVTIGSDPRQQLVLDIPAPLQVLVHAIDGETGAPIGGIAYMCAWKGSRDVGFFGGNVGRSETAPGQLEFKAPVGTVSVEAQSQEYSRASQTLDLSPGVNEMTLTLLRNYRVEYILREGEKVVPWTMAAMDGIKFERVDGQRMYPGTSFGSGRLTSVVSEAGIYRVTLPKLAGYVAIEPFQVNLEQRGSIEKVVQIIRE